MQRPEETDRSRFRALPGWIALALAAVPPLLLAGVVRRFALDMPIQDQWGFAHEIIAFVKGEYPPAMIFFPVGQHRVVLPKLVMLPLAALTGWDVRAEI